MGAIPLSIVLYRIGVAMARSNATLNNTGAKQNGSSGGHAHGSVKATSTLLPLLGGNWSIPNNTSITPRLLAGAALFGIGWALEGVCREYFPILALSCGVRLNVCHGSGTCLGEPWPGVYYDRQPPRRLAENRDVAYCLCCRWAGHTLENVGIPERGDW